MPCPLFYTEYRKVHSQKNNVVFGFSEIGGDGGSRTRVRKLIPATFYEHSRSFRIPLSDRRTTNCLLR